MIDLLIDDDCLACLVREMSWGLTEMELTSFAVQTEHEKGNDFPS